MADEFEEFEDPETAALLLEQELGEDGEEALVNGDGLEAGFEEEAVQEDQFEEGEMPLEEGLAEEEMPEEEGLPEEEPEEPVEEEVEEEEEPEPEEEEVEEHLKEAMEGNLRLKRMLDGAGAPNGKRAKTGEGLGASGQMKANQLLAKWGLQSDQDTKHVIEGLQIEEIQALDASHFVPNKFDQRKSCCEQVAWQTLQLRERACPGSYGIDPVHAFKFKWKLDMVQEKQLRALNHKDLRYVTTNYDGTMDLEDVISEASGSFPEEDMTTSAIPEAPGCKAMGRFMRLELIDPLSDAVVFGDANLTFSVKLAMHRKALGHVGRVVATTFENIETLRERYPEIDKTITVLEEMHAEVWHEVDCTRIAVDPKFKGVEASFGAVYYNYPHAGAVSGFFDGHPVVNWRHENLMRLFFRALRFFVKPGGIVKVSSNAKAVGVRYSYIIGSAVENDFVHVETVPFMEWVLHRYGRSYGDRRDRYKRPGDGERYNAQRAEADMVYCFQYKQSDDPITKQTIRRPPTLKTLQACNDGPFRGLPPGPGRDRLANELYKRFVSECSGVHVG